MSSHDHPTALTRIGNPVVLVEHGAYSKLVRCTLRAPTVFIGLMLRGRAGRRSGASAYLPTPTRSFVGAQTGRLSTIDTADSRRGASTQWQLRCTAT